MERTWPGLRGRFLGSLIGTLVLAAACTDASPDLAPPVSGGPTTAWSSGGPDAPTAVHEAEPPSYAVPESPSLAPGFEDGGWVGGPGRRPLRPGATYVLAVSSPLPPGPDPEVPEPRLRVELTVPAGGWSLQDDVIVSGSWDEGAQLRVLALDRLLHRDEPGMPCDSRGWRDVRGLPPAEVVDTIIDEFAFDVVEPPAAADRFGPSAVHVVLRLAPGPEAGRCLDFNLWTYRKMRYFSETVELWVLDVGGRVVVVDASRMPTTRERLVEQQGRLLSTLRILAP